jgi:hypothetical protein
MKFRPVGVLMLSVLCAFGCARERGYQTIEGRVYARLDETRGPLDAVVGARVSNNWDQTTATTDSSGRFVIRVKRVALDEFVILRVEAGDRTACHRMAGTSRDRYTEIQVFLDGGRFGHQRCESSRSASD